MTEYYTFKDVAEILKISETASKALFNVEGFPIVRIGHQTKRIRADKLDEWLEEHQGEKIMLDYSKV